MVVAHTHLLGHWSNKLSLAHLLLHLEEQPVELISLLLAHVLCHVDFSGPYVNSCLVFAVKGCKTQKHAIEHAIGGVSSTAARAGGDQAAGGFKERSADNPVQKTILMFNQ